eukprot:Sspe_Gene.34145::Locus_16609_Transcript_1_1_Confidence_1.000_Length_2094::g.34145::m.34145
MPIPSMSAVLLILLLVPGVTGRAMSTQAAFFATQTWPECKVPYMVEKDPLYLTDANVHRIDEGIGLWKAKVPELDFYPMRPGDFPYVRFVGQPGYTASAHVGMSYGENIVRLGEHVHGVAVAHELGHVLGMIHEHSRADRDRYVTVHLNRTSNPSQFDRMVATIQVNGDYFELAGIDVMPYDYKSAMHYGNTFFSKDGRNTIDAPVPLGEHAPSDGDAKAVRFMYNSCEKPPVNLLRCVSSVDHTTEVEEGETFIATYVAVGGAVIHTDFTALPEGGKGIKTLRGGWIFASSGRVEYTPPRGAVGKEVVLPVVFSTLEGGSVRCEATVRVVRSRGEGALHCTVPVLEKSMMATCAEQFPVGRSCVVACRAGWVGVPQSLLCGSRGEVQGKLPECKEVVPCSTPRALAQHVVEGCTGSVAPGGQCTVRCREGTVGGSAVLRCPRHNVDPSATPLGSLPICLRDCPPLRPIKGYDTTGCMLRGFQGATCNVTCPGASANPRPLRCEDGEWKGELPRCEHQCTRPTGCFGLSCDAFHPHYTCTRLEGMGCDCRGCACKGEERCRRTCLGLTCDEWQQRRVPCSIMSSVCDCSGCGCHRFASHHNEGVASVPWPVIFAAGSLAGVVGVVVLLRLRRGSPEPPTPLLGV